MRISALPPGTGTVLDSTDDEPLFTSDTSANGSSSSASLSAGLELAVVMCAATDAATIVIPISSVPAAVSVIRLSQNAQVPIPGTIASGLIEGSNSVCSCWDCVFLSYV